VAEYVYILSSQAGAYVGMTNHVFRRFGEHVRGDSPLSCRLLGGYRPSLVNFWTFPDRLTASKVERLLWKRFYRQGPAFLLKIARETLDLPEAFVQEALALPDIARERKLRENAAFCF